MRNYIINSVIKYKHYLVNICILLFISNNFIYSQQFFEIQSPDSVHFIEDPLSIELTLNISRRINLYYSLDSGVTWIKINQPAINNIVALKLPFTLSNQLQIKAVADSILPLKLIWENNNAHIGEIRATNFSPDGKLLLTLGKDGFIKIWEIGKRVLIDQLFIENNDYTYDAKFFHSNTKIIFSSGNNAYLWDRNANRASTFYTLGNFIRKIDVHPKDNKFAVITDDNNLAVFQQTFFLPIPIFLRLYSNSTYKNSYSVRYSESGENLAISTFSGDVITTKGSFLTTDIIYHFEDMPLFCSEFCSNDRFIAYPTKYNNINLYDIANGFVSPLFPPFNGTIRDIKRFGTNYLGAVSLDSSLQEWDLEDFSNLPISIKEPYSILNLDYTKTGDTLATSGRNNTFRIWKNFAIDTVSQIININIKQKIIVNFAMNKPGYIPGDSCEIAVLFDSQYQDTLSKYPLWHFRYNIFIPNKLFNISNGNFFPNDLISEKNSYHFLSDTFRVYEGIAILTDENHSSIFLDSINAEEPNNFAYLIEKKDVDVSYFCLEQSTPKISVDGSKFNVVLSNWVENVLHLEVQLVEDGEFDIEIYSTDGKILREIYDNLKYGYYSFDIDLSTMAAGMYILKVKNVSQVKFMKFLKL